MSLQFLIQYCKTSNNRVASSDLQKLLDIYVTLKNLSMQYTTKYQTNQHLFSADATLSDFFGISYIFLSVVQCSYAFEATVGSILTLKGVPGEAQLADNVSRDVRLDALTFFSMTFSSLQQVVELLWIKLLQHTQGVRGSHDIKIKI